MSENTNTAFMRPNVWRIIPQLAARASANTSIAARKKGLLVQKHIMANKTANSSFATGFMR